MKDTTTRRVSPLYTRARKRRVAAGRIKLYCRHPTPLPHPPRGGGGGGRREEGRGGSLPSIRSRKHKMLAKKKFEQLKVVPGRNGHVKDTAPTIHTPSTSRGLPRGGQIPRQHITKILVDAEKSTVTFPAKGATDKKEGGTEVP